MIRGIRLLAVIAVATLTPLTRSWGQRATSPSTSRASITPEEIDAHLRFLSSDLLELVGVCDRVLVVYRGRLAGSFSGPAMNSDALLAVSSGARSNTDGVAA